jgi:hypothetical protein
VVDLDLINLSTRRVAFRGRVLGVACSERADLPDASRLPVLLGLGSTLIKGGGRMTIPVNQHLEAAPCRLYVPRGVLEDFEVLALTSEIYLNAREASRVPAAQLDRRSLMDGGIVRLAPDPVVLANTFITIEVSNLSKYPRTFTGAVLATRA